MSRTKDTQQKKTKEKKKEQPLSEFDFDNFSELQEERDRREEDKIEEDEQKRNSKEITRTRSRTIGFLSRSSKQPSKKDLLSQENEDLKQKYAALKADLETLYRKAADIDQLMADLNAAMRLNHELTEENAALQQKVSTLSDQNETAAALEKAQQENVLLQQQLEEQQALHQVEMEVLQLQHKEELLHRIPPPLTLPLTPSERELSEQTIQQQKEEIARLRQALHNRLPPLPKEDPAPPVPPKKKEEPVAVVSEKKKFPAQRPPVVAPYVSHGNKASEPVKSQPLESHVQKIADGNGKSSFVNITKRQKKPTHNSQIGEEVKQKKDGTTVITFLDIDPSVSYQNLVSSTKGSGFSQTPGDN